MKIVDNPPSGSLLRLRPGVPVEVRLNRGRRGGWRPCSLPGHVLELGVEHHARTTVVRLLPFDARGHAPLVLEYGDDQDPGHRSRTLLVEMV